MGIRSIFTAPPSESVHPVYRYGMLVFILILLVQQIQFHLTLSPAYDGDLYRGYVGVLMLLFMHLSFAFKWPKRVAAVLWVLVLSWLVFYFCHTLLFVACSLSVVPITKIE